MNTGNESLGLKGQWENKANSSPMVLAPNSSLNNKTFFNLTTEYKSIKQQSPLGGSHFVNGEKPNIAGWRTSYFDVYYGKEDRVVGGNKVSEKTLQNIRIIE